MNLDDLIGTITTLRITRLARADALLAASEEKGAPRIIIARDELPRDAVVEDGVRVFVHLDADGDVVATTHMPKLVRGEVTFLQVTGVTPFGAFVDWGLKKDLLVHNRYQTGAVRVGSRHPFGLILDDTGRLTGTMKIRELVVPPTDMEADAWVDGEAWREEPDLGLFVILQKRYLGLLPAREPHRLKQGEKASFRVAEVLPDGKVVLSLRAPVAEQMGADATQLLTHLRTPGALPISEAWSPERIAQVFGMSKKAFKRAVGRLLKDERVTIHPDGAITLRGS
jgi:predicted RNA-binding protein (virulence factor B family)